MLKVRFPATMMNLLQKMTVRRLVVLCAIACLIALPATASAQREAKSKPHWVWTESYAERTLLKKLRIPCKTVRGPADCNALDAQAELDDFNQQQADWIAGCEKDPLGSQERLQCLQGGISVMGGLRNPKLNLEVVTKGFRLVEMPSCIGSGTGVRFRQLRCSVSVEDFDEHRQRNLVGGNILVTVTGRATFRWSLI